MLANWPPVDPARSMQGLPKLREAIGELYDSGVFPPADIYVGDTNVVVELAIPGANPDDLQVAVTNTTVTVVGEVRRELGLGEPHFQGIWRGQFHPSMNLPVSVDPSSAEATYRDGMLTLRMVKAEVTQPQLVPVRHENSGSTEDDEIAEGRLHQERVRVNNR